MRTLVIVVALLACIKVWSQDHLYRNATETALISAYRVQAMAACQKRASLPYQPPALATTVEIGNPAANVALWDWQNPLWDVRFRHLHLVIDAGQATTQSGSQSKTGPCRYDVVSGIATFDSL